MHYQILTNTYKRFITHRMQGKAYNFPNCNDIFYTIYFHYFLFKLKQTISIKSIVLLRE